jgi:hypothetical protein
MQKNGDAAPSAVLAKFFSGSKIPIFSLMVKTRKPSASTLGYVIKILMIIKLAISILQGFL